MGFDLGKSYTLVTKECSPSKFQSLVDSIFGVEKLPEMEKNSKEIFAVISGDDLESYPLYENQGNYLMSDTGSTITRLRK